MIRIPFLDPLRPDEFPPVSDALRDPDGLLAGGGDLRPERLLAAYRRGIFPWYSRGQPILWWSPDPRTVYATDRMHVPRRLARWLRKCRWTLRADTARPVCVRPVDGDHRGAFGKAIAFEHRQAERSRACQQLHRYRRTADRDEAQAG